MRNREKQLTISFLLAFLVAISVGGTYAVMDKKLPGGAAPIIGAICGLVGVVIKEIASCMNLEG